MDIQQVIEGLDQMFANRESNKVEDYLSSYLEKALTEGDVGSAITIMNELIGYYRDTSQYDKAETYCGRLLPFMENVGLKDTVHYGTSCLNIANAYRASGRLEDSLCHYQMVFEIYEKLLNPKDFRYASLNNNLALLYQERKEYDKACDALKQALSIVKEYPEAVVEQAVTYTNLAASYIKAGEQDSNFQKEALTQAEECVKKALSIFENGLTGDYHYSAARSVAGDVSFACGKYQAAAECYEAAMLLLKQHVGMTHAYFRIVSNLKLCYEKLGYPEALKGMTISRDYYEEYGKVLAAEYPGVCIAKVGEGSECFGFDDILSMDHDFGPSFCIFVTRQQYADFGADLEKAYEALPKVYRGMERPAQIPGAPRHGVIVMEDFFTRILDLSMKECTYLMEHVDLPESVWIRCSDWQLKTVSNGSIFAGQDTLFGQIYHTIRKGYPMSIKRRRMAQLLGQICQEGQYNYPRMMQRGDLYGAKLLLQQFQLHVVNILYLLNEEYAPHEKWLMFLISRRYREKSWRLGQEVFDCVKQLMELQPNLADYVEREMQEWIGRSNEADEVWVVIQKLAGLLVQMLKEEGYTQKDEVYLEEHVAPILAGISPSKE